MTQNNDQLTRYRDHRAAATLADGRQPYAWWKQYQRALSIPELTHADIERDAARIAKRQAELTNEHD